MFIFRLMARPLSETKRDAILASAAELIATLGIGASTAKIAKAAGIAQGTLFTYFATKDELLNRLFLEIESDLAGALLASCPAVGGPCERIRHMWDRAIEWGLANPVRCKAMRQLKVSDRISTESRRRSNALFREIREMVEESVAERADPDRASFYIGSVLSGLAEITIEAIAASPRDQESFKQASFDLFWKGIAV